MKRISTVGPKSGWGPVGWGWLSPPDQFLDHLTVIKRLTSQPEALSDEGYHRTTACWHFFISVLKRGDQLKNQLVFDTDDENVIDLPRQTLRFLSLDASLATILPPKINKVWLFVAQKVDKSFTPEQRKSVNIFIRYLKDIFLSDFHQFWELIHNQI